jgi:hypothetical protein
MVMRLEYVISPTTGEEETILLIEDAPTLTSGDTTNGVQNEDAAATAKQRCKAILTSRHAEGREALAHSLAFDSNLTAEQAMSLQKAGVSRQTVPSSQSVPAGRKPAEVYARRKAERAARSVGSTGRTL